MKLHIFLGNKGGIGKSLAASIFSQYLYAKNQIVRPYDADHLSGTLVKYKGLPIEELTLTDKDNFPSAEILSQFFRKIEKYMGHVVLDCNVALFLPMLNQMLLLDTIERLEVAGVKVTFHSVITGGQSMHSSLLGLNILLNQMPADVVVWENEYFGRLAQSGKVFKDSKIWAKHKDRIPAVITLQRGYSDLVDKDMDLLHFHSLTFNEADESPIFGLLQRARIKSEKDRIFSEIDQFQL